MRAITTVALVLLAFTLAEGQEGAHSKRFEQILEHDDGTVTVRLTPMTMKPGELAEILETYVSDKGKVKPAGRFVLIRDHQASIRRMEKVAISFDPPPQAALLELKIVWLAWPPGEDKEKTEHSQGQMRKLSLVTVLGRNFESESAEQRPTKSGDATPHDSDDARQAASGVLAKGFIRPAGKGQVELDLEVEVKGALGGDATGVERFLLTAPLKIGEETVIGNVNDQKGPKKRKGILEMLIFAKVQVPANGLTDRAILK